MKNFEDDGDDLVLVDEDEVMEMLRISRTALWRLRRGDFPAATEMGLDRLVWLKKAIKQWILEKHNRSQQKNSRGKNFERFMCDSI